MQDTKKIFSALPATGDRILCAGIKILSRDTEPELITIEETAPSYPKVMTVDSLLWGVVWKISKIIYYYNPHIQLKAIRYHQKEWIRHCLQSSNSAPTYTSWCIFSPMFTDTQRDAHRSNFYNRKLWPPHTHSHTHIYKYIYFIIKSEKTVAPHSSTLAWKIPWTEKPGRLQSMGSLRVRHDWVTWFHFSLSCIGEGNGNPLQCSCLENLRDSGAWWAAIYGVTQSWTGMKRLSSSSKCNIIKYL